MRILCYLFFSLFVYHGAWSQPVIRDNSFLIEEAFNQEKGVIQHINTMLFNRSFDDLSGSFTEEWPVGSEVHQLSLTLPYHSTTETSLTLNDILINYRYQLVAKNRLFMSPRLSVELPTGPSTLSESSGMTGFQLNIPASFEFNNKFTMHANAGNSMTFSTVTKKDLSLEKTEFFTFGISSIYMVTNSFNLMVEAVRALSYYDYSSGEREIERTTVINPGFRFALNFPSGMQIVPGCAMPYNLSSKTQSFFFYLSVEHSIKKTKS